MVLSVNKPERWGIGMRKNRGKIPFFDAGGWGLDTGYGVLDAGYWEVELLNYWIVRFLGEWAMGNAEDFRGYSCQSVDGALRGQFFLPDRDGADKKIGRCGNTSLLLDYEKK
jgi:hypothetical protein